MNDFVNPWKGAVSETKTCYYNKDNPYKVIDVHHYTLLHAVLALTLPSVGIVVLSCSLLGVAIRRIWLKDALEEAQEMEKRGGGGGGREEAKKMIPKPAKV